MVAVRVNYNYGKTTSSQQQLRWKQKQDRIIRKSNLRPLKTARIRVMMW